MRPVDLEQAAGRLVLDRTVVRTPSTDGRDLASDVTSPSGLVIVACSRCHPLLWRDEVAEAQERAAEQLRLSWEKASRTR